MIRTLPLANQSPDQAAEGARLSALALLVATAATMAFFHRAIFSDGVFSARDIQRVYYPLKQFWVTRVSAGQLPEWYPYDGLGRATWGW